MTDQTVNVPLLRKAVEWAEAEAAKPAIDREWFQGSWISFPAHRVWDLCRGLPYDVGTEALEAVVAAHCGTAYCIAGYVAQSLDERYATDVRPTECPHASEFAAEALGIEIADPFSPAPDHLFYERNTITDVRRIAESLAGERL